MAEQVDQERPRTRSRLSFASSKNRRGSRGSFSKSELVETAKEKAAHKLTSKADPTRAINEAQPASAALEESTMESIRAIQHRDANGDIITDPDRSNPTRPRLERPLETIRSFEAAIDGSYNRRMHTRAESDVANVQSRRNSYYQGNNTRQRTHTDGGGYYGNRMPTIRSDHAFHHYQSPPNAHFEGRRFGPRMNSDPALYGQNSQLSQNPYHSHSYQQSYDTGGSTSANESHSTDPWGNSTDPSSENSSIDRVQQISKPDLGEVYGFNGFGGAPQLHAPILEERGSGAAISGQPNYGQSQITPGAGKPYQGNRDIRGVPPSAPPSDKTVRSEPIRLGNPRALPQDMPNVTAEKRKSWLKRRFSKA